MRALKCNAGHIGRVPGDLEGRSSDSGGRRDDLRSVNLWLPAGLHRLCGCELPWSCVRQLS